jgi:hypothetical protein
MSEAGNLPQMVSFLPLSQTIRNNYLSTTSTLRFTVWLGTTSMRSYIAARKMAIFTCGI